MRIAIIGGLGFIGRTLVDYAHERGHIIDVYDMIDYVLEGDESFQYYQIDLSGESQETLRPADAIVILAAKRPYVDFSFIDYESNVRIAERCFRLAYETGISNVIFASSKAVYSDPSTMPWKEELYTSPLSLYGASKVAAEQLAYLYNIEKNMFIKCLRFAQVIGLGERKGYLINTLIDNAINKKQQIVFGDGSQRRQYIYIKDICRAIIKALESPNIGGVFNIGIEGTVSNLELAECINAVFNNNGNLICDYNKKMDSFCDEMNVQKAKAELGFTAEFGIRELFEDIARTEQW